MKTKISEIIEGMDRTNFDDKYYLDCKNGRVFESIESECFYIDNAEAIDGDKLDDIIALPNRYEINEYKIINDFISTLEDSKVREQLYRTICGKGAFRRFKDFCIEIGIIDKWYRYREKTYYELAKEWCLLNNVDYFDDYNER